VMKWKDCERQQLWPKVSPRVENALVIPCVTNLTEVKSCMLNKICCMAFLLTSVSMFNYFTSTFTEQETLTFSHYKLPFNKETLI
jgi:hypothetical protein